MSARLAAALLFALSLPAAAQEDVRPDEDALVPEYIIKPVTEMEFEGYKVGGALVGPGGVLIVSPPERHHQSMIQLRVNFDEQMSRSVDQVK